MKKTNIILRRTVRNKACKTCTASPTPLSFNKAAAEILCSVFPHAECKEDEPKKRSRGKRKEKKNTTKPKHEENWSKFRSFTLRKNDKGMWLSLQACKILKKKENPLFPMPAFTKMKLHALIPTGQTLGGAISKTVQ